jgi:hypothetical protein
LRFYDLKASASELAQKGENVSVADKRSCHTVTPTFTQRLDSNLRLYFARTRIAIFVFSIWYLGEDCICLIPQAIPFYGATPRTYFFKGQAKAVDIKDGDKLMTRENDSMATSY